jgi:hypothetical protein
MHKLSLPLDSIDIAPESQAARGAANAFLLQQHGVASTNHFASPAYQHQRSCNAECGIVLAHGLLPAPRETVPTLSRHRNRVPFELTA